MKTVQVEFATILRVKIARKEALDVMGNANGIKPGDWP